MVIKSASKARWSKSELKKLAKLLRAGVGNGPRAESEVQTLMLEYKTAPAEVRQKFRAKLHT